MYGNRGNYFGSKKEGFHNSIWIELIGFDRDKKDFGVSEYLDTIGFIPDSISFHLTSIDFVNNHKGMAEEYTLPDFACSYGGHERNDRHARQPWTNYDLRNLTKELQSRGIMVLASMFDFKGNYNHPDIPDCGFAAAHPELLSEKTEHGGVEYFMIKRFRDGSFYEDFLLQKLIEVKNDYDFDGFQLADGISSPRLPIWYQDFSDDIIEQSGIVVPKGESARDYIPREKAAEWIKFFKNRWGAFLEKIISGLKNAGAIVAVNSVWTRDPFEALYRYGIDYKSVERGGADFLIAEDVSSDLAILEEEYLDYPARKLVHYEFLSNLLALNSYIKTPITPLFMLWDNLEQWDVVHHAPTALPRAAAANFSHFSYKNNRLVPPTSGPHFCLGDALENRDWDFIRLAIDNAYTETVSHTQSATFIWSDARMDAELNAFIKGRLHHSTRLLALLLRNGAQIGKMAHINDLGMVSGDIVITNFELLPKEEKQIINSYNKGRIIKTSLDYTTLSGLPLTPADDRWAQPLAFSDLPEGYIEKLVEEINQTSTIRLTSGDKECTLHEIFTDENHSRVFIENNEYYYSLPEIETNRKIKSLRLITKPEGYPFGIWDRGFKTRVPPRGVEIAEVEYE